MTPVAPTPAGTDPIAPDPTTTAAGAQPWPESWRDDRSSRPSTQYWDIETACWHCAEATGAAPEPRPGD
jgi:hypothetical protein